MHDAHRVVQNQLSGCINDVRMMKHLLLTKFGFTEETILMLTEDDGAYDASRSPTRHNIMQVAGLPLPRLHLRVNFVSECAGSGMHCGFW